MTGRDPSESGRVATTLELFFDLVFVVAFSVAGIQVAEHIAEGHIGVGVGGFVFVTFAAIWAWINFSWFASAFDTDDWVFRITTMCQMVGVAIIAMGIPAVFSSLDEGTHVDNRVLVLGYVVMRVAMSFQWLRAGLASQRYRRACFTYAIAIWVAQIGWIAVALADLPLLWAAVAGLVLVAVELSGPMIAERPPSGPTPWHAHHIAERYGLLTIITLGEGIVGTVAALQAVVEVDGWSFDAAVLGLTGMAIPFAMWWIYFVVPTGEALHLRRAKCFVWGYGHILLFMAAAGVGAGLHVAALYIEHKAHIGPTAVVAAVAIPLGLFCIGLLAMYDYLLDFDAITLFLGTGVLVLLGGSVALAASGVSVVLALVVTACAPIFLVAVDEFGGGARRHAAVERVAKLVEPAAHGLA